MCNAVINSMRGSSLLVGVALFTAVIGLAALAQAYQLPISYFCDPSVEYTCEDFTPIPGVCAQGSMCIAFTSGHGCRFSASGNCTHDLACRGKCENNPVENCADPNTFNNYCDD